MSLVNGIPSIAHNISDEDFTAYTYYQVYAISATTATINGTAIPMVAGTTIKIRVKSASGSNFMLLGSPMATKSGLSYNGYDTEILGGSAFLSGVGSEVEGDNTIGFAVIGDAIIG